MNKNKKELTFLVVGVLMLITVILYTFFAIQFLVKNLSRSLSKSTASGQTRIQFEVQKAEILYKK